LSADVLLGSCMAGQLSVFTGGSAGLPMGSCVNSGLWLEKQWSICDLHSPSLWVS